MGDTTKITWADHTWNPWRGCEHAKLPDGTDHPGCLNCYAETQAARNPQVMGEWGHGTHRGRAAEAYWDNPIRWNAKAKAEGVRRRVFPSFMDPWEDRPDLVADRHRMLAVIHNTPWLDYLLLTKRPQNIRGMWHIIDRHPVLLDFTFNVWNVISASDQNTLEWAATEACGHNLKNLSPVTGISFEPQIGPIVLTATLKNIIRAAGINWVILGGESGHMNKIRECRVAWIRDALHQFQDLGIAVFVKQLGSKVRDDDGLVQLSFTGKGEHLEEWPDDIRVQDYPKTALSRFSTVLS